MDIELANQMIALLDKQSQESVDRMIKRMEEVCLRARGNKLSAPEFVNDVVWALANMQSQLSNVTKNDAEKQFLLGQIQEAN
jgi:hypothetical protein